MIMGLKNRVMFAFVLNNLIPILLLVRVMKKNCLVLYIVTLGGAYRVPSFCSAQYALYDC